MLSRLFLSMMLLAMMALVQASSTGLLLEKLHQIQIVLPKRQATNISLSQFPRQCQGGCATAVTALNTCSSATCLCNGPVDKSLGQCINCSVNADATSATISSGQQVLDTYNSFCKGTNVSSLSLSVTASILSNGTVSSTLSVSFSPSTTITQLGTPTTITSLPSSTSSSSGASPGIQSNIGYGSIGVVIALLVPLLA